VAQTGGSFPALSDRTKKTIAAPIRITTPKKGK
jgi:hypothetical protein